MKVRKIPLRQCIGCMEQKPKKELIRIVRSKDGNIQLDMTGKANGRGAYICKDIECFQKMHKKRGLNRAFGQEVDEEVYQRLFEELDADGK